MDDLKPCPFCGAAAEVQFYEAPTVPRFYWVACTQCQVDTPPQNVVTEQDARDAWNTRVGIDDEFAKAMQREYKDEDPPPPHVIRAMSRIAIYAATYGTDNAGWFLRDTTIAEPLAVVREWLKEWGFEF